MNYTKGKWERHSAPNGYHIWCGNKHIADVGDKEDKEQSGNAYLISAAPDMYEALKATIARRMECHETESAYIPPEIELAYKALAKAEGGLK